MKCPNDNTTLQMSDRNGIEIDYCPECRGIWLDRGELDKLIERAGSHYAGGAPAFSQQPQASQHQPAQHYGDDDDYYKQQRHHDSHGHHDDHHNGHHKKKKEGFLDDLFDF